MTSEIIESQGLTNTKINKHNMFKPDNIVVGWRPICRSSRYNVAIVMFHTQTNLDTQMQHSSMTWQTEKVEKLTAQPCMPRLTHYTTKAYDNHEVEDEVSDTIKSTGQRLLTNTHTHAHAYTIGRAGKDRNTQHIIWGPLCPQLLVTCALPPKSTCLKPFHCMNTNELQQSTE